MLLLFVFGLTTTDAQSCYVFKDEASGYNVQARQAELEAKACELVAAFDSTDFANQFKVFSFGFYMQLESYDGYSYPQAFLDMQAQVQQESPYYLLIGRQSDPSGVFTKYWVEVKLPISGIFSCANTELLNVLETRILVAIESEYSSGGKSPSNFFQAEIKGMEVLQNYVLSRKDCCSTQNRNICDDCVDYNTLQEILLYRGYQLAAVSNVIFTPKNTDDGIFKEEAEIFFKESGTVKHLNPLLRKYLDSLNKYIEPIKAEIIYYDALNCVNIINQINQPSEDALAKISIVISQNNSGVTKLFFEKKI